MSEDHSKPIPVKAGDPVFLSVKAGMTVIVRHLPEVGREQEEDSWWMAESFMSMEGQGTPRSQPCFRWQTLITELSVG